MSLITNPEATPPPAAQQIAATIRDALASAARANLDCYRQVRLSLYSPPDGTTTEDVLAQLGEGAARLPQIATAVREVLAMTDESLAAEFDKITADTAPPEAA